MKVWGLLNHLLKIHKKKITFPGFYSSATIKTKVTEIMYLNLFYLIDYIIYVILETKFAFYSMIVRNRKIIFVFGIARKTIIYLKRI